MLPENLAGKLMYAPVEDVLLPIMRPALDPVPVFSLIVDTSEVYPFVVVRNGYSAMYWRGDHRGFVDHAYVQVDVFDAGLEADAQAARLSEVVRVVLWDAFRTQQTVALPEGNVSIAEMEMLRRPRRESDWATASGPVQYADLPSDAFRYESLYRFSFRYSRP